jgi:hypothetical protein|tara:strand:- start:211 stop:393 length:183 start_codon:yes stop_codon:yes gene_type:complete
MKDLLTMYNTMNQSLEKNHDWDFNADVRDVRKVLDWLEEFNEMEQDKNKFLKKWNRGYND